MRFVYAHFPINVSITDRTVSAPLAHCFRVTQAPLSLGDGACLNLLLPVHGLLRPCVHGGCAPFSVLTWFLLVWSYQVEVRNFLGEKRVRRVELAPGVTYVRTADVKDQIELSGNDLTAVSITGASAMP